MILQLRQRLFGAHGSVGNAVLRSAVGLCAIMLGGAGMLGVGRRVRRDLAVLSRLDDHMLRDIGVSRWDVERLHAGSDAGPENGV